MKQLVDYELEVDKVKLNTIVILGKLNFRWLILQNKVHCGE